MISNIQTDLGQTLFHAKNKILVSSGLTPPQLTFSLIFTLKSVNGTEFIVIKDGVGIISDDILVYFLSLNECLLRPDVQAVQAVQAQV